MARPKITTSEKLEIQLKKQLNRRRIQNVVLRQTYSRSGLPSKSTFLADVIDKTGCSIPFTEAGFLVPQHGFVNYADIKRVHWISRGDLEAKAKEKRDYFDRLEFELSNGSTLILKDLDKAVFPLLKFFEWLLREREEQDESLFLQESAHAMFKDMDKQESS